MTTQPQLRWHDLDWQKQAHEWIRAQTKRHSIQITGAIEQNHAYAWSTVIRAPTNEGMIFFQSHRAGNSIRNKVDRETW